MKRKDLWAWLEANRPGEKTLKALTKAMQKEKNCYLHNHVAACAEVKDGNLVIGVYWGEDGSPYGVYYMTPCGNHHYSKDGKTWVQEKLRYIPKGGYSWCVSPDSVKWFWLGEDEDTVLGWISANDELEKADVWKGATAERRIDCIETNLSHLRAENARERRITRITDYVYRIMKDPQGIDLGWVNNTVFGGKHYAFLDPSVGSKKDKVRRFFCSACGGTVDAPWKHNKTETCPLCGADLKVSKTTCQRVQYERVSYFYRDFDIKGRLALVMVTANVKKVWRNGSEDVTYSDPRRVLTSPLDWRWGNWATQTAIYYNQYNGWSDRNSDYFQTAAGYIYLPEPDVLKDTFYEDMLRPTVAIAERGWRVNYSQDVFQFPLGFRVHPNAIHALLQICQGRAVGVLVALVDHAGGTPVHHHFHQKFPGHGNRRVHAPVLVQIGPVFPVVAIAALVVHPGFTVALFVPLGRIGAAGSLVVFGTH